MFPQKKQAMGRSQFSFFMRQHCAGKVVTIRADVREIYLAGIMITPKV